MVPWKASSQVGESLPRCSLCARRSKVKEGSSIAVNSKLILFGETPAVAVTPNRLVLTVGGLYPPFQHSAEFRLLRGRVGLCPTRLGGLGIGSISATKQPQGDACVSQIY